MEKHKNTKHKKQSFGFYTQLAVAGILLFLGFYLIGKVAGTNQQTIPIVSASGVAPTGVPAIYGKELGINYNEVSASNPRLADATIKKLSQYEGEALTKEQTSRYIKIAGSISCEYCCGARALILTNGKRACGCAHSYAMRGLTKYLLINHPEMNDSEILTELGKWKTLFFPGILEKKAEILKANGIKFNYINLASNKYRGIEKKNSNVESVVKGC